MVDEVLVNIATICQANTGNKDKVGMQLSDWNFQVMHLLDIVKLGDQVTALFMYKVRSVAQAERILARLIKTDMNYIKGLDKNLGLYIVFFTIYKLD